MANPSDRNRSIDGVFGDSRGRLLRELCGRPQTAVELAERVGTSSNAVRVHLDGLRAAGLVQFEVLRRGVGKPTHLFSLTATAENLLSTAYAPALQALFDTLSDRLDGELRPVLRQAGEALSAHYRDRGKRSARPSLAAALMMLEALGSPARVGRRGSDHVLSNQCCPLSAITRETPEMCGLMEAFVSAASGLETHEQCARGLHPRCSFLVKSAGQHR